MAEITTVFFDIGGVILSPRNVNLIRGASVEGDAISPDQRGYFSRHA